MTPADEAQAQAAFLEWFRGYMTRPDFSVGPDAVRDAWMAAADWAWTLRDVSE